MGRFAETSKGEMFGKACRIAARRVERICKRVCNEALPMVAASRVQAPAATPTGFAKNTKLATGGRRQNHRVERRHRDRGVCQLCAPQVRAAGAARGVDAQPVVVVAHAGACHLGPLFGLRELGSLRPQDCGEIPHVWFAYRGEPNNVGLSGRRAWRSGGDAFTCLPHRLLAPQRGVSADARQVQRLGQALRLPVRAGGLGDHLPADLRARLENVERKRRKGQKLILGGAPTWRQQFDTDRQWDWSFSEVVADGNHRKRKLEEPALLALSKIPVRSQVALPQLRPGSPELHLRLMPGLRPPATP